MSASRPQEHAEDPTDVQEDPNVSTFAVVWPVAAFFVVAFCVLAILTASFWVKLGILPISMPPVVVNTFPDPHLQISPVTDLRQNLRKGQEELTTEAVVPIDRAMAMVAERRDGYAPLLPQSAVPDTAPMRALTARRDALTRIPSAEGGPTFGAATAGARTNAMSPSPPDQSLPFTPGVSDGREKVPGETLRGTPSYHPPGNSGEVTR